MAPIFWLHWLFVFHLFRFGLFNFMMHNSKDEWLRFACANTLLDRGHGKPRDAAIFEQQEALSTNYRTLDEIKADLKSRGLPIESSPEF